MTISICIPAYNKPHHLRLVLESIYAQQIDCLFETIVVDDCGVGEIHKVCRAFPVRYTRLERPPGYRSSAKARNIAYKLARGDVIITQPDDVIHHSGNCIQSLFDAQKTDRVVLGFTLDVDYKGNPNEEQPRLLMAALHRRDLCAIGGYDEDFSDPVFEDDWFMLRLTKGRQLEVHRPEGIVGHHLSHPRFTKRPTEYSRALLAQKVRDAQAGRTPWISTPWEYNEDNPLRRPRLKPTAKWRVKQRACNKYIQPQRIHPGLGLQPKEKTRLVVSLIKQGLSRPRITDLTQLPRWIIEEIRAKHKILFARGYPDHPGAGPFKTCSGCGERVRTPCVACVIRAMRSEKGDGHQIN